MSSETISEVAVLDARDVLQMFNEDLGQYINSVERFKLGRVLTIIDAAIADPEQRKAIKDLVNNGWWAGNMSVESKMTNPHEDLRALCEALGFVLYPDSTGAPLFGGLTSTEFAVKRYKDAIK